MRVLSLLICEIQNIIYVFGVIEEEVCGISKIIRRCIDTTHILGAF